MNEWPTMQEIRETFDVDENEHFKFSNAMMFLMGWDGKYLSTVSSQKMEKLPRQIFCVDYVIFLFEEFGRTHLLCLRKYPP